MQGFFWRCLRKSLLGFALAAGIWSVAAKAASGPIIIDPKNPRSFQYQSGERFFPMGDTAYFLIAQPTNVIARYLDVRRAHKFNFTRVMALADGFWPFGGTPDHPEDSVINAGTAVRDFTAEDADNFRPDQLDC